MVMIVSKWVRRYSSAATKFRRKLECCVACSVACMHAKLHGVMRMHMSEMAMHGMVTFLCSRACVPLLAQIVVPVLSVSAGTQQNPVEVHYHH